MRFLVFVFFFGCAYAMTDLESGEGICSLCVQNNQKSNCCTGNIKCESEKGTLECVQKGAERPDFQLAQKEFSNSLYDLGSKDFCSICCGRDSTTTQCCTGLTSCSCTKSLYSNCM